MIPKALNMMGKELKLNPSIEIFQSEDKEIPVKVLSESG